jgi:integrase/recombinase XerD
MSLHHALAAFLDWSAQMNISVQTTRTRAACLKRFILWCNERSLHQPQDITKPILERYRRHLYQHRKTNGEPLSFNTQYAHLMPIKAFFKWLAKENYILYSPASELDLPQVPKRLPQHGLTLEEINALLNHTRVRGEKGIRDRAIMETLYSSGLRRMELVNLRVRDVDVQHGTVFVNQGKGNKDRIVPIGARAAAWVRKYRDEVRPTLVLGEDNGILFLTDHGEAFINNRLSDLIKRYLDAVGIDRIGACHLFRHSMATHMLENGADIRYIQMMLGHANLSTTQIYTHVSIQKLQAIHAATHPAKLHTSTDHAELVQATDEVLDELQVMDQFNAT